MPFMAEPVIKKFFSNKIESSLKTWGDYLLEVADIFSTFDGEPYDRDLLSDRFIAMSGRSPYALRDQSNFRDEFGAYGTFLGVYRIEKINGIWHILLSKAARTFLCSPEPDVESFCRIQLALFQYPNGAGVVYSNKGTCHVQANVRDDTLREIKNNVRVSPFRLICRFIVLMHEELKTPLPEIEIPYDMLFIAMNDSSINNQYLPDYSDMLKFTSDYKNTTHPLWVADGIKNFKRNFHIFEKTGVLLRTKKGLRLNNDNLNLSFTYAKMISELRYSFDSFEALYGTNYDEIGIQNVVLSPEWGRYYDAANLSMNSLSALCTPSNEFYGFIADPSVEGKAILTDESIEFPDLHEYQGTHHYGYSAPSQKTDPLETMIKRERANREHSRILNMVASIIRTNGNTPLENEFIDLFVEIQSVRYLFEIKSNTNYNTLSQVRKGISQLYEYRYRSKATDAKLVLVLQSKPTQQWIIDYLVTDRNINVCWLADDIKFECPSECESELNNLGIL